MNCGRGSNILVLRSSTLKEPHFVFLGFSHTGTQSAMEEGLRELREEVSRVHGDKVAQQYETDFREDAERGMISVVEDSFGRSTSWEWRRMNLFTFV